jgi:N-acetylmuramoyl-L-alanine amidase
MQGDALIYGRLAALILALSLAVGCGAGKIVRADPVSPNSPLPSAATPVSPTATPPTAPPLTPPTVPPPTVPPPAPTPVTPVATAPVAAGVTGSIAGKIVVIDPGHAGGNVAHARDIAAQVDIGNGSKECDTVGAQAADGYSEHALNFDVAQRVRDRLSGAGAQVVLTRGDDTGWGPCITRRAAIGNEAHAAAAISIHADGGPSSGRGFHIILPAAVAGHNEAIVAPSRRLGQAVHTAFTAATGEPTADYLGSDGYTVRSDLGGLNLSTVPKVFIEMGNMDNAADAARLETPAYREQMAAGIATGITAFLTGG